MLVTCGMNFLPLTDGKQLQRAQRHKSSGTPPEDRPRAGLSVDAEQNSGIER